MDVVVKPTTTQLSIGDGQYIVVKRRLNTGEVQDLYAAVQAHPHAVLIERLATYLTGWSLQDGGEPLPMSALSPKADRIAMLRSLDPELFYAIGHALDAHETAIEKEIEEAKKSRAIATASPATLRSPDDVTGDTNGSSSLTRRSSPSSSKNSKPKMIATAS